MSLDVSRTSFLKFVAFSGAGLLSAACVSLLLSGRVSIISAETSLFLTGFLIAQTFGLTIVKFGSDQLVFALATKPNPALPSYTKLARFPVFPLTAIYGLFLYLWGLDGWVILGCLLILPIDALSIVRLSELSARKYFLNCAFATLLNYPLFFLLCFGVAALTELTPSYVIGMYGFTSVLRLAVTIFPLEERKRSTEDFEVPALLGLQQVLNYGLFRLDSVVIASLFAITQSSQGAGALPVQQLLYILRLPEIVAGLCSLLSSFLFAPLGTLADTIGVRKLWTNRVVMLVLSGNILGTLTIGIVYYYLWAGSNALSLPLLGIVILQSCLILPANFVTFMELRTGRLKLLVLRLAGCVLVGSLILYSGIFNSSPLLMLSAVPVQLLLFVLLFYRRPPHVRPQQREEEP